MMFVLKSSAVLSALSSATLFPLAMIEDPLDQGKRLSELGVAGVLGVVCVVCVTALIYLYNRQCKENDRKVADLISLAKETASALTKSAEVHTSQNALLQNLHDVVLTCRKRNP